MVFYILSCCLSKGATEYHKIVYVIRGYHGLHTITQYKDMRRHRLI